MVSRIRTSVLLFLLVFSAHLSTAQETLTIKYFGLTIHPFGDPTADLQPNKLDKDAHFVANIGLFVGYENFIYEDFFSIKLIQGFVSDCSNGFASVTHLGPRIALLRKEKHRLYFGIGPTLLVRDSWNRFGDAYESSGYFNETYSPRLGELQWKLIPYAFEFEYDYAFTPENQLSVSLTPGVPAMIFSIGWKHWFHLREYDDLKLFKPKTGKKSKKRV
ncbi:MAG: hypothetical protein ACI865_001146 [Flavobacteriaceae bacterium]|jgi:hypothetical protein